MDFTTAYARRKAHAEFADEWAEALARFRAAKDAARKAELAATMVRVRKKKKSPPPHFVRSPSPRNRGEDESGAPSPGSPAASPTSRPGGGGAELVIRRSGSGAKLVRASAGRWSKAKEERLLVELATCGSVRLACKAIGISEQAVSKRRLKDRYLDEACEAAIQVGRGRLGGLLVELGNRTFDPDNLPLATAGAKLPKMTVAEAIQIAKMDRRAAPTAGAAEVKPYDVGEVRARLEKKMRVLGLLDDRERGASAVRCIDCGRRIGEEGPAAAG